LDKKASKEDIRKFLEKILRKEYGNKDKIIEIMLLQDCSEIPKFAEGLEQFE
jgi:hypothetical protein